MKPSILFLSLLLFSFSLSAQYSINCYNVLDCNIPNPERGFTMYYVSGTSANTTLLKDYPANATKKLITQLKKNNYTLIAFVDILKDYKTAPISQGHLDTLARNLQTMRDSGLKCVLEFYYDVPGGAGYEPGLSKILMDISALKPVVMRYQDIIYTLKHGFIGPWGEEWTSSNLQFGGTFFTGGVPMINQAHYRDRKIILDSILNMFSDNKIICDRQPLLKMNMFGKCYADSITASTAYSAGSWYRVGYYNDGFLGSSDDLGTWQWGMPLYNSCPPMAGGVSNTVSDGALLLNMINTETKYTINGGETAAPNDSAYRPGCGGSVNRMREGHFSFLSSEWYGPFIENWKNNNCYGYIEKRLGYRFTLDSSTYYLKMQKENQYNVKLYLSNLGFASTTYKKRVSLVFRRLENNWMYSFPLDNVDTRRWYPGEKIAISYNVPTAFLYGGTYDIYLQIQDQSDSLKDNKQYNVRLATEGIWDDDLKMNKITKTPCTIYWKETPGVIPTDTVYNCPAFNIAGTR